MDVLEIPGYVDAVLQERLVRDAAFLDVTETVGPFELLPMTLRHWLTLRITRSPLLDRSEDKRLPTPTELTFFLRVLTSETVSRAAFERRCRRTFYPPRYLPIWNTRRARVRWQRRVEERRKLAARIIDAARAYVAEAMQDEPPASPVRGFQEDYYSDAAWFCVLLGTKFGWTQQETLNMPLKRLFQYVAALRRISGDLPMSNPSDSMKARWMRTQNAKNVNPKNQ